MPSMESAMIAFTPCIVPGRERPHLRPGVIGNG
jgi:hypothetical protein